MPPASRNQRVPTGGDTPAPIAAFSLDRPAAINAQKRRRSSRRAIPGRPGDLNLSRNARSDRRLPAIATFLPVVLRRPVDSAQFTSDDFTDTLKRHAITISMDGKGRYMDNIFVERLWRSLKYEEVYLNAYASVAEAKAGIGSWLSFYNQERQHQSLGYRTPRQAYEAECPWICGRSASPTGCAFAHIPTGTAANNSIDVDEGEDRSDVITVAPAAIGAGTEIGRATP
jgi:putative transposase